MQEDYRKDFQGMSFLNLTLLSNKIKIGIIGAGRAGLIKAKSFVKDNAYVEVLSLDFSEEFYKIKSPGLKLIKGEYKKGFILDKHIVVIAVDGEVKDIIRNDCEKESKIYIDATSFKSGNALRPMQGRTKNLLYSINTLKGNPRAAVFVSKKLENYLKEFDEFVELTTSIRNKIKDSEYKQNVMNFLNSDDFYEIYQKGKHQLVLKLFLEEYYD